MDKATVVLGPSSDRLHSIIDGGRLFIYSLVPFLSATMVTIAAKMITRGRGSGFCKSWEGEGGILVMTIGEQAVDLELGGVEQRVWSGR